MNRHVLVLAAALAAPSLPLQAADVFQACSEDLERYCSNVEPGHGRLLSCFYAHETVISAPCQTAIADTADVLDLFFERVRYVKQECGEDVRTLCSDVALGEGRVLTCLAAQRAALSEGCTAVIDDVPLPSD